MKGYFIIAMILELFLVIFAGNMVGKGHYGAATSAGLCAIILANIHLLILLYGK